jgi:hypothetical protein
MDIHAQHRTILPYEQPTLRGRFGLAWLQDLDAVFAKLEQKEIDAGRPAVPPELRGINLAGWLIYAPGAHPIWHSYCLNLTALRDVPGMPPPHIYRPGEHPTHEFFLFAMDPGPPPGGPAPRRYRLDETNPILMPMNFGAQFKEPTDARAMARIRTTVQDVIDGRLNPDTDGIQQWIRRFGASNIKGDVSEAGVTVVKQLPDGGGTLVQGTGASAVATIIAINPKTIDVRED